MPRTLPTLLLVMTFLMPRMCLCSWHECLHTAGEAAGVESGHDHELHVHASHAGGHHHHRDAKHDTTETRCAVQIGCGGHSLDDHLPGCPSQVQIGFGKSTAFDRAPSVVALDSLPDQSAERDSRALSSRSHARPPATRPPFLTLLALRI
jgi:hypothetical protein